MKKIISFTLLLSIILTVFTPSAFAISENFYTDGNIKNFEQEKFSYSHGRFKDINENDWYGANAQGSVKTAYGLGLMQGTSFEYFSPNKNITVAEVIAIASRIAQTYIKDNHKFTYYNKWYEGYVKYAVDNEIIGATDFYAQMEKSATRAEMAYILSKALPSFEMEGINSIEKLPDVPYEHKYHKEIFKLYEAGILTGSDEYGNFHPDEKIDRASASAIISRIVIPKQRKKFKLKELPLDISLDFSKYTSVIKPQRLKTYEDFVTAWSWMMINSQFKETFYCDVGIDKSTEKAFMNKALMSSDYSINEFPEFSSFVRKRQISLAYDLGFGGTINNLEVTLSLENANDIPNNQIIANIETFKTTCQNIVTDMYKNKTLTKQMSQKEKAYILFEYVAKNTKYDHNFKNYTGYDAAVNHLAVCQGYTAMYNYMCNLAGVPMRAASGDSQGVGHQWNEINVDGIWHNIDVTWASNYYESLGKVDKTWFWLNRTELEETEIKEGTKPRTYDRDNLPVKSFD